MCEVDVLHSKRMVDAALPHLEAAKGSIIAVASVSGREVDVFRDAYGVMKAAVIHYIAGLAFDLAPKGVRANVVSPGNVYFDGGVWQNIERNNPELFEASVALNPTGRLGTPEETAYAVVVLASPRASRISGTNLLVDGALTRGVQL
jgi:NAD(P)-dependent dehydrogenase (short-subunit alcohol dehydrogenase family)